MTVSKASQRVARISSIAHRATKTAIVPSQLLILKNFVEVVVYHATMLASIALAASCLLKVRCVSLLGLAGSVEDGGRDGVRPLQRASPRRLNQPPDFLRL